MKKVIEKVEQRGTLLVEAIAMLGLIAMVTPTLYKKSAERLNEIQDINAASQMRTFNQIIETFVRQKIGGIKDELGDDLSVIELVKNDDASGSGVFSQGYSSVMPFGYRTDEIKNYQEPRVFVHFNRKEQDSAGANPTITTYIVYPHISNPGKKRAARLASLVGANGGMVLKNKEFQGTGGAWFLDNSQVTNILEIPTELLTENNVVVTSQEPIEESSEDNVKYLYRVHQDNEPHRNTMITNLYMGGNEEPAQTGYNKDIDDFYSIFNVRKMTLNTNCDYETVKDGNYNSSFCDPAVADLYVGKPFGKLLSSYADGNKGNVPANNGAAWIYGNLTAMNEGFQVYSNADATKAKFLFHPTAVTNDDDSTMAEYALIDAELDGAASHVKFMGDFVSAEKDSSGTYEFTINPGSSFTGDMLFYARYNSSDPVIKMGMHKGTKVYIAEQGGEVYINSGSTEADDAKTIMNSGGGLLEMGYNAGWMQALGRDDSAKVHILKDGGSTFTVGGLGVEEALIYGDVTNVSSSFVALKQGRLYIENENMYSQSSKVGWSTITGHQLKDGLTTIATNYVDIYGNTYIGTTMKTNEIEEDGSFARHFTLGVAGSAWVDDFLWARKAWVGDMGIRNFHAGASSLTAYNDAPEDSWFNVYNVNYPHSNFQGGGVVIRDPQKVSSRVFYADNDVMFLARSGEARVSDTEGAKLKLEHGETFLGSENNFFYAGSSDTSSVVGSSIVSGVSGVYIRTLNNATSSGVVSLQHGAFELYGHPDTNGGNHVNKIIANAQKFALRTGSSLVETNEDDVQFYVDDKIARYRDLDFAVQRSDSSSVFGVNIDSSLAMADNGKANIEIDGSMHVTGNEVIHIASNSSNTAIKDGQRAMFEIDPDYIRVWAKDKTDNSFAGSSATNYYSMLEINPHDVKGGYIDDAIMNDTSIYIRRGAIELMKSDSSLTSNGAAGPADAGFGYIKANRFVSNTDIVPVNANVIVGDNVNKYDQYMVNPAYTSVMHDIKLTTRGGARLSDVLPDFVLKGVYNVSNDFVEESNVNALPNQRIGWSAGDACGKNEISCVDDNVAWASPYMGKIPFAMCPPGYANMATIVPISFQLGKAGNVVPASEGTKSKWMVTQPTQQADILLYVDSSSSKKIYYPFFHEIKSFSYNDIVDSGDSSKPTWNDFIATMSTVTEGWFYGLPSDMLDSSKSRTRADMVSSDANGRQYWQYTDAEGETYSVATPLYFQDGTFLKTTVTPNSDDGYWEARMGFIYDKEVWKDLANGLDDRGILSNNTTGGGNETGGAGMINYVWNLFPVPTNTLEGHATVYCYFDRTKFEASDQVQQLNMMNAGYMYTDKQSSGVDPDNADAYIQRLHDPSLMYNDPW